MVETLFANRGEITEEERKGRKEARVLRTSIQDGGGGRWVCGTRCWKRRNAPVSLKLGANFWRYSRLKFVDKTEVGALRFLYHVFPAWRQIARIVCVKCVLKCLLRLGLCWWTVAARSFNVASSTSGLYRWSFLCRGRSAASRRPAGQARGWLKRGFRQIEKPRKQLGQIRTQLVTETVVTVGSNPILGAVKRFKLTKRLLGVSQKHAWKEAVVAEKLRLKCYCYGYIPGQSSRQAPLMQVGWKLAPLLLASC